MYVNIAYVCMILGTKKYLIEMVVMKIELEKKGKNQKVEKPDILM